MEIEDALLLLNDCVTFDCEYCNRSIRGRKDKGKCTEMKCVIADVAAKQIPDAPREHYHWGLFTDEEKLEESRWFCPECDGALDESWNNCAWCGQRLEWE